MKLKKIILTYYKKLILFAFIGCIISCVEEIPIKPEDFEKAIIIIEGTLTNENKQHQVKLSQAFAIDTTGPSTLSGARVKYLEIKNIFLKKLNLEFIFPEIFLLHNLE